MHKSVGAIIRNGKDEILLIDRKNPPFGWACPAGHVNPGEAPEDALKREVKEETNLDVLECKLLVHEFVPWNECSKGVKGHDWFVYEIRSYDGETRIDEHEARNMKWVTIEEMSKMKLEQVWKMWFEKMGII